MMDAWRPAVVLGLMLATGCDWVFSLDRPEGTDAGNDGQTLSDADAAVVVAVDGQLPSQVVFRFSAAEVCVGAVTAGTAFLRNSPAVAVTVTITSANPAQLGIDPPQVFTFDSTNWSLARTIVARGIAVSSGPVAITATTPNDNTVTDGLIVTPPCN